MTYSSKIPIVILTFILGLALALNLRFAFINQDAAYYLSIARDISNGQVPYKDINSAYTPLMMYMNSFIYYLFIQPKYFYFLIMQYMAILSSCIVLYNIVRKYFSLGKNKAILLSIILFISILSSDGTFIILEVYSIAFVLLAFYYISSNRYFLSGFLLALTFFFKQYGILNFVPFYLFILLVSPKNQQLKNILSLSIGGIIPLIIFLLYFSVYQKVEFQELIFQLSGQGYAEKSIEEQTSLRAFLGNGKVFILLLISLIFVGSYKVLNTKISVVLIAGVIITLIPLIIQSFSHYWINSFPYLFLLIANTWKDENQKFSFYLYIAVFLISIFLFRIIYTYKYKMEEQLIAAEKMENYYPKGSNVFVAGEVRYLYILNDYKNPLLKKVGYDFSYLPSSKITENFNVISDYEIAEANPYEKLRLGYTTIYIY